MNKVVFEVVISQDIFVARDIPHCVIIVIFVPNRCLFHVETMTSFVQRFENLDINRIVTSTFADNKYCYMINVRGIFTDCL